MTHFNAIIMTFFIIMNFQSIFPYVIELGFPTFIIIIFQGGGGGGGR